MSKKPGTVKLTEDHRKALQLIENGNLSINQIADECNVPRETLIMLISGNTELTGVTGELFKSELSKIHQRNVKYVKRLFKENQKLGLAKLNERLRFLMNEPADENTTYELCKIMSALGKAGPAVEISNTSYSITKGMTAEELIHEFNRLETLAKSTLDGGRVSSFAERGTGELLEPDRSRSEDDEGTEAPTVSAL